jgi:membrane protease YdiL (CAAX protease family)
LEREVDGQIKDFSNRRQFWLLILRISLFLFATSIIAAALEPLLSFGIRQIVSNALLLGLLIVFVKLPFGWKWSELFFSAKKLAASTVVGYLAGLLFALVPFALFPEGRSSLLRLFGRFNPAMVPVIVGLSVFTLNGIACVFIAFGEELAFRGIILPKAAVFFKKEWLATIFASGLFVFFHLDYLLRGHLKESAFIFVMQISLCLGFFRFRNIAFAIAWHYAYDTMLLLMRGMSASS